VRYRDGVTPWDAGGVPARLLEYVATLEGRLRILVPGCGSGYEVALFAQRGHDVRGIDFSDEAVERARRLLGRLADRVEKADAFALEAKPFDLVYERTFLCALPRERWPQWSAKIRTLVRPGGTLAGFFYFNDNERGPPFGISAARLHELLDEGFAAVDDMPVPAEQSVAVLAGKERWQVWQRRL
jgi:SAM-dependent methyltransferase